MSDLAARVKDLEDMVHSLTEVKDRKAAFKKEHARKVAEADAFAKKNAVSQED